MFDPQNGEMIEVERCLLFCDVLVHLLFLYSISCLNWLGCNNAWSCDNVYNVINCRWYVATLLQIQMYLLYMYST